MQVRFRKLSDKAVLPTYAHSTDCALDLTAISSTSDDDIITYHTGLAVEIPSGYAGLILPRSSICKTTLVLCNSVGLIDVGYTGEILIKFRSVNDYGINLAYAPGDRVAQLLIVPTPKVEPEWTDHLPTTARGTGGFGSSGQ